MAKIVFPKISNHLNSTTYFQELMIINKRKNSKFSHRLLAQQLKWPISYTADLIKGRKRFTVARALELAQYANYNILNTEKILYLSLSDSSNENVRNYFTNLYQKKISPTGPQYNKTTSTKDYLFEQVEIGAVLEVLKWARKPLAPDVIKKLLYTFHELTIETIDHIIKLLIEEEIIKISGNKLMILKNELNRDRFDDGSDGGIKIHTQYAQNFIRYTQKPQFPGLFTSGFIEISKDEFNDVAKKLLEIRNWLLQLSLDASTTTKDRLHDTRLYQFDINLVLMIDKNMTEI